MPDAASSFLIARNPDPDSTLPYLLRVPVEGGVLLKARDRWPTTARVYCHPLDEWPADAEIIEEVAVRHCARRGAAIDLVLDRGRNNRSQIVFTKPNPPSTSCGSRSARASPSGPVEPAGEWQAPRRSTSMKRVAPRGAG